MIQIPTAEAPGVCFVDALSPWFTVPESAVQQRVALSATDAAQARRYVVLEGESARTLVQSASQQSTGQEAVLEGKSTGRKPADLVVRELQTYQWSGTQRSLPVEVQWPGYTERPSTFIIVDPERTTREELTTKIAQWVRTQLDELRKVTPRAAAQTFSNLGSVNDQNVHLIGLYSIEDERREVLKYVVDLSMDRPSNGV